MGIGILLVILMESVPLTLTVKGKTLISIGILTLTGAMAYSWETCLDSCFFFFVKKPSFWEEWGFWTCSSFFVKGAFVYCTMTSPS
ncbi:hypothetical protein, partial [Escherichia coli]|uniref:hypothetical protein n=1 Tax=Escherichia coli TaxID=562 RepID=UPI001BFC0A0C